MLELRNVWKSFEQRQGRKDVLRSAVPDGQFRYTNTNYHLAARLVEQASGEEFNSYLRKHVFEPLGMRDTVGIGVIDLIPIALAPFVLSVIFPLMSRWLTVRGATWLAVLLMVVGRVVNQVSGSPLIDFWSAAIAISRWLLLGAILIISLALCYRIGPCRAAPKWRWVAWGAAAGAALWILASLGFSLYVRHGRTTRRPTAWRGLC